LVWPAGIIGVLATDAGASRALNPGAPEPFGHAERPVADPGGPVGRRLVPGDRTEWLRRSSGYEPGASTAFFPLYPLLIRALGEPIDALGPPRDYSFKLAGVFVSLAAFIVALYLLHRLTELELGRRAADNAVALLALFPTSLYFSAIYPESLFLALSVGCLYSARSGWWWRAAALGTLATATRSQGLLLLLPLTIMLWYRPRTEQHPAPPQAGSVAARYRPSARAAASLLLVPLGLVAFMAYVRETTRYGAFTPFKAQELWGREFRGPILGLWDGVKDGASAVHGVLSGAPLNGPDSVVRRSLVNVAAVAFAGIGVVGALRRLPIAYGVYALGGLLVAISYPVPNDPLRSLPRFVIVLFPIFMWAGWALTRSGPRRLVLLISAAGLACFSAAFASGFWIA
jgi:Mannosyltransferase (PIG-V)